MPWSCILIFFSFHATSVFGYISPVQVSLDNQDAGFFLRFPNTAAEDTSQSDGSAVEKFTLLDSSGTITVRAGYGPFSVKQTVFPTIVLSAKNTTREEGDLHSTIFPMFDRDLDITAHLVTPEVRRDKPVLRVLFHGGHGTDPKTGRHEESREGSICMALYVRNRQENLMAVCSLGSTRDGVCLAQVTLPAVWWPPAEGVPRGKQQKNWVRVEYVALQSHDMECSESSLPVDAPPSVRSTFLTDLTLSEIHGSYEEIKSDDLIRILVPQDPVYPKSKVYIPVQSLPNPAYPLYVFVIRARVKSGMRILGAQVAQPSKWQISLDLNAKKTLATVTAFVKNTVDGSQPEQVLTDRAQEVFSWLFEVHVDEDADFHDGGHIVWQLRYALDSSMSEQYDFDDGNPKMTSRLDIQKDDVQAVLPIAKSNQLMNMAVLTGKQVSQPMKVFIVSQAGEVADVTLKSSCHSADESILKVSPSCTSVYLDGSEIRGSQNASVLVKYGTYVGQTHFLVWMPELPLDVRLSDNKLSQIKGWRTPHLQVRKSRTVQREYDKRTWDSSEQLNLVCRLRYQQAKVDVYTKFVSVDHNSGREAYLLNRKVGFRITDLVAPFLRVADSRIASLKGSIVRGQEGGRTEVQVLSPITGRVNGAREVRVGSDKETITHLQVTIVTGLQLAVFPDTAIPQVFLAQTSVTHKLTSQYQEGLLDIKLHFSDRTVVPLSEITETDYHLSVDTFDSSVIAFAPAISLHHPRVIAIGQGKGDLVHVSVELADRCQKRRSQPLAMAYAYVDVNFTDTARMPSLQNDARFKMGKPAFPGERQKMTGSVLYRDSINPEGIHFHEPTIQHRQNPAVDNLTPLEIGMYSLLGVFCLAVFVFVISCTVFAVRYRKKLAPTIGLENTETVAHAHDWVWLGRATLERNSVNTRCSQTLVPATDFNGNAPVDGSKTEPQKRHVDKKKKNRNSDGSFPGSEISIRITTNPQQRDESTTVRKPVSSTFSREKRVQSVGSRFSTFSKPPPIPPHRTSPHNNVNVTDNPMSETEWEAATKSMNYEQLVEYFVNLKESNA